MPAGGWIGSRKELHAMSGIHVAVFMVRCAQNLLICDDLYTENLHFASIEDCRHELPQLIEKADTPRSVVMARCRYLLVEPDQPRWRETGRYW
jgi:hypothetical protein